MKDPTKRRTMEEVMAELRLKLGVAVKLIQSPVLTDNQAVVDWMTEQRTPDRSSIIYRPLNFPVVLVAVEGGGPVEAVEWSKFTIARDGGEEER